MGCLKKFMSIKMPRNHINAGLLRYGKCQFYRFYLKFGVQKSLKSAINKKWQIPLNLINFPDVSCKSVSCWFYWGPAPSNPVETEIPITTRRCLAWINVYFQSSARLCSVSQTSSRTFSRTSSPAQNRPNGHFFCSN
jgi:hypothetical protein